jgi:hypothetical protein
MKKSVKEFSKEFDWLGYCTSCNIDCCHNMNSSIPEKECTRQDTGEHYRIVDHQNTPTGEPDISESYDNRPLECRLFPFDIKEIDQKLVWIVHDRCHATPKLDYGKFINFFEGHFSRTIPLDQIQKYVEHNKVHRFGKYESDDFKVLKEVNWPNR